MRITTHDALATFLRTRSEPCEELTVSFSTILYDQFNQYDHYNLVIKFFAECRAYCADVFTIHFSFEQVRGASSVNITKIEGILSALRSFLMDDVPPQEKRRRITESIPEKKIKIRFSANANTTLGMRFILELLRSDLTFIYIIEDPILVDDRMFSELAHFKRNFPGNFARIVLTTQNPFPSVNSLIHLFRALTYPSAQNNQLLDLSCCQFSEEGINFDPIIAHFLENCKIQFFKLFTMKLKNYPFLIANVLSQGKYPDDLCLSIPCEADQARVILHALCLSPAIKLNTRGLRIQTQCSEIDREISSILGGVFNQNEPPAALPYSPFANQERLARSGIEDDLRMDSSRLMQQMYLERADTMRRSFLRERVNIIASKFIQYPEIQAHYLQQPVKDKEQMIAAHEWERDGLFSEFKRKREEMLNNIRGRVEGSEICTVCYQKYDGIDCEQRVLFPCFHPVCLQCYEGIRASKRLLKINCPICSRAVEYAMNIAKYHSVYNKK